MPGINVGAVKLVTRKQNTSLYHAEYRKQVTHSNQRRRFPGVITLRQNIIVPRRPKFEHAFRHSTATSHCNIFQMFRNVLMWIVMLLEPEGGFNNHYTTLPISCIHTQPPIHASDITQNLPISYIHTQTPMHACSLGNTNSWYMKPCFAMVCVVYGECEGACET